MKIQIEQEPDVRVHQLLETILTRLTALGGQVSKMQADLATAFATINKRLDGFESLITNTGSELAALAALVAQLRTTTTDPAVLEGLTAIDGRVANMMKTLGDFDVANQPT